MAPSAPSAPTPAVHVTPSLDEGTAKHTGPQIAEMIEDVGGTLSMGATGGSVHVLAPHRHLGLELLLECLAQPNFPKEAFNRQRSQQLSAIDDAERQPQTRARRVFRETVYGKHPYGSPNGGRRATVEKLTPADCAAFHRRLFVPNNTLLAVVGDFDSRQVAEEVQRLTAG